MRDMDENSMQTLSTVAAMYYLGGDSQDEIARRFYTSRSTVSRMLKKARSCGIVDIKVNFCAGRNEYYEGRLRELFGVDAVVINSENAGIGARETIDEKVCRELATWMQTHLHAGNVVGVTRGSIFYDVAEYLKGTKLKNVFFAQLMGTEAPSAGRHYARDVVKRLSAVCSGRAYYLDAPLVFQGQEAREALFKVPTIAVTLSAVREASLLMTTIPRLVTGQETHIWQGFIDGAQFEEMIRMGAVGAMFGRAFNARGRFLDTELNRSIVGADMEVIRSRRILAVSYGAEFARAVLGALRSGYINDLITDSDCAKEVISLTES